MHGQPLSPPALEIDTHTHCQTFERFGQTRMDTEQSYYGVGDLVIWEGGSNDDPLELVASKITSINGEIITLDSGESLHSSVWGYLHKVSDRLLRAILTMQAELRNTKEQVKKYALQREQELASPHNPGAHLASLKLEYAKLTLDMQEARWYAIVLLWAHLPDTSRTTFMLHRSLPLWLNPAFEKVTLSHDKG